MVEPRAFAVYETAAALERAEASAHVLAARARTAGGGGRAGAGTFAALGAVAPRGLVPPPGAGAGHLRRHLEQAAQSAMAAEGALPEEVGEALAWAAAGAARQAAGAGALDPQGVAREARRAVAAVRGLARHTMRQDAAWELLRLGTFLPRAGWVAALVGASARLAVQPGWDAAAAWAAAAAIAGADGAAAGAPHPAELLVLDGRHPLAVAHAVAEVEGALAALEREGGATSSSALPLARMAHARLRDPQTRHELQGDPARAVDEVLDLIGALAAAAVPVVPSPVADPLPGPGRARANGMAWRSAG